MVASVELVVYAFLLLHQFFLVTRILVVQSFSTLFLVLLALHRCSPLLQPQGASYLAASVELVVVSADLLLLLLP